MPIDVDMVIDLDARACGLLIEAQPDQLGADITRSGEAATSTSAVPNWSTATIRQPLEVQPRVVRPRPSVAAAAGRAFAWPTIVQVGPEATRLASLSAAAGATGLSEPKRYLWDDDPGATAGGSTARRRTASKPGSPGVATTLVNDLGEGYPQDSYARPANDEIWFPSIRALYARRNLMSFALAEIFVQAIGMMNAPSHRLRRRNADLPRRLRRIIATIPTAMPLAERQIMQRQAETARDLVYLCTGAAATEPPQDGQSAAVLKPHADTPLPAVILKWDEASATQAVYLYSQIALHYSGDARASSA